VLPDRVEANFQGPATWTLACRAGGAVSCFAGAQAAGRNTTNTDALGSSDSVRRVRPSVSWYASCDRTLPSRGPTVAAPGRSHGKRTSPGRRCPRRWLRSRCPPRRRADGCTEPSRPTRSRGDPHLREQLSHLPIVAVQRWSHRHDALFADVAPWLHAPTAQFRYGCGASSPAWVLCQSRSSRLQPPSVIEADFQRADQPGGVCVGPPFSAVTARMFAPARSCD